MDAAIPNDEQIVWTGTQQGFGPYVLELWSGTPSKVQEALTSYSIGRASRAETEDDDFLEPALPSRSLEHVRLRAHVPAPLADEDKRIWMLSITSGFRKAITNVDKKLQGRVLEAITELTREPTTLRGDTIKPLDAERKGCWRYRIGDWRLIYRPEASERVVILLDFAPRSGAYA